MYTKKILRRAFFGVSVILILLAYILKGKGYILAYDVLKDFVIVLGSIVLVNWIWKAKRNNYNKTSARQNESLKVYSTPKKLEGELIWLDLIKKANHQIDIQGLSLTFFTKKNEFMEILKERIVAGVKVRVMMMAPDNPLLDESIKIKNFISPERIKIFSKFSIKIFQKLQDELESIKNKKGQFIFQSTNKNPISMVIRRFDDKLFVVPYIWNEDTTSSPVYYIKGKNYKLFQSYMKNFEDQFDR